MSGLRTAFVAAIAVAACTPAFARSSYAATDWKDLVSRVNCKDAKQLPDGQWQINADVSIGGNIKSDPIVPNENADTLQKKCAGTH